MPPSSFAHPRADAPKTTGFETGPAEAYVHRIGRTGRVDAVGDAFTLMSPEESKDVAAIERFLGRSVPRVMLPDFDYRMKPSEIGGVMTSELRRERPRPGSAG